MVQPSDDKSSLGFSNVVSSSLPATVVEGYNGGDYVDLYKEMVSTGNTNWNKGQMRKYGMTSNVEDYPSSHPEYLPDTSEKMMNDSQELLNQQYTNLTMVFVTTAALGLIAIMITAGGSPSSAGP